MSTALYRRYRPDTFADVIGQEHVTTPLMTALEKNRVNHAYLFSGPRGCGKTTSARILARCLNCAQGPTPTPCGTCPSCVELASGGPGSLDVIEIDAASHGGVDDARDLRERATFAPVRDKYKIFIIDEAHMVTSAGFNALLKIVEEPPEHIKFIFATTEPDKVIGTIRSRTHHYPFRLVPPEPLIKYLEYLCTAEGVEVAPGVLSLVIRAGGGSVRDSLSVLDQLIAGAGPHGLDYELAVSLLGYTHASLLDDVVDALGAGDAKTVFGAVDRVVQTGHDPRRFVEDLLERFRDLIIVRAVPENAAQIIRGLPEDQLHRMQAQAAGLGQSELSRWADVTNAGLTEMTGATSPRLHLELLCARLLLPASDATERGFNARMDRVERRLAFAGDELPPAPSSDTGGIGSSSGSGGYEGESSGQGAAAVREALRAARAQKEAGNSEAPAATVAPEASAPVEPVPEAPVSEEPAPAPEAESAPVSVEPVRPTTSQAPEPQFAAPAPAQPDQPEEPTANPADWGGTWGPVPEGPINPVTEPVSAAHGSTVHPPANVPPFSILPDRAAEDVPAGEPVAPAPEPAPIQQNQAMADFTKKAKAEQAERERVAAERAAAEQAAQEKAAAEQRAAAERAAQEKAAAEQRAAQQQGQQQQRQIPPQQNQQPRNPAAGQGQMPPQQQQGQQQQRQMPPQQNQQPQNPAAGQGQMPPQQQQGQQQQPPAAQQQSQGSGAASGGTGSVEMFRRAWPDILEELKNNKKFVWAMVAPNASITGFDGRTLTVSFAHSGAMTAFTGRHDNVAILGQCIQKVLGVNIELVIAEGGSAPAGGAGPKVDRRPEPAVTNGPAESASFQRTAAANSGAPAASQQDRDAAEPRPSSPSPRHPAEAEKPTAPVPSMAPAAPQPVAQPVVSQPQPDPAPEPSASSAPSAPSAWTASDEDPGFGPEPTWDSEPWDDGGGDWDAASVPVPDWESDPGTPAPEARVDDSRYAPAGASRPAVPAPARPEGYVAPAPSLGDAGRPVAPPPGASAATWGMPVPAPEPTAAPTTGASAPANGAKLSRYQRLMNRAAGITDSTPAPVHAPITTDPAAGAWGNPDDAPDFARPRPAGDPGPPPAGARPTPVESDETEFVPSDDDIEIEDSSLIGVPAIERILNGRIIEERDAQGNVIERPNRPR
ncbi:DNA polymerase III subunit gamma and tau [Paeniglutamicibacter gangotriensis]|uniref:DNA polymerase III subunit gamma/tau n=1 Tax=Paeniglutamicibacter gangotriensis Lz1y TaxID=1276920 RepID=M7NFR4_9MICC|nr:DNA polymerase III subunit gamma and tau [Paeniglutamicibacter gangotriensis]EMQ97328.1 DNA polymerase III subunits gamma and tau [Paeniglutamicibacter gangotriensis Lz1y]